MSVLLDANEPEELAYLMRQMGIEVQVGSYNQTPGTDIAFPDAQVINDTYTGVSRKQATEIMGDIDAVIDQLRRELRVTESLCLCYEGNLTWHEDGTFAGDSEAHRVKHHEGRSGNQYDDLTSRGLVFHQPHTRWTSFVWRCQDLGIPVIPTGNVRGTAAFIHWLHEGHPNRMFQKLIPVRQQVLAENPRERAWKLLLMAIPGVGPEAAVCIADVFPDMTQLVVFLAEQGALADLVLPSGRRLGAALERKIRQFLGVVA